MPEQIEGRATLGATCTGSVYLDVDRPQTSTPIQAPIKVIPTLGTNVGNIYVQYHCTKYEKVTEANTVGARVTYGLTVIPVAGVPEESLPVVRAPKIIRKSAAGRPRRDFKFRLLARVMPLSCLRQGPRKCNSVVGDPYLHLQAGKEKNQTGHLSRGRHTSY